MSDISVSQILNDAKDLLMEGRIIRGTLDDGEGGFCSVGAVNKAITSRLDESMGFSLEYCLKFNYLAGLARAALRRALPTTTGGVIAYNDSHGDGDVLALFDRAIVKAKGDGA